MKSIIVILLIIRGMCCFAGNLEKDFEKLLALSGGEYLAGREDILKNVELKEFLHRKLREKHLPLLSQAEAYILLEWIENRVAIQNVLAKQVIGDEKIAIPPKDKDSESILPPPDCNIPVGGFHYPQWLSLKKEKLEKLMAVYDAKPCPYFILECLWKFSGDDIKLVARPFKNIPKHTCHNPEYIFFGMARTMPDELKELFALALESRISTAIEKNRNAKKLLPGIEQLAYLGRGKSARVMMNWISHCEDKASQKLYLIQFIPMVADANHREELMKYAELYNGIPDSEGFRKYYLSFLSSLESGKGPDDLWIRRYLILQGRVYPLAFFEEFIYRVRPDLKGKITEGPLSPFLPLTPP
jgi:hypothetical protein